MPQNALGHLLGHVRDLGGDASDPQTRVYKTKAAQPFHTDSCDVVGLLCLRTARVGGQSAIASTPAIWNEMVKRAPELAELATKPLAISRKGEIPEGKGPW